MKSFKTIFFLLYLFTLLSASTLQASLSVTTGEPKTTGSKVMIKLSMQNTYTNAVESARAAVFLMDDTGKVVGQSTQWVIGGTKDKPSLAPNASADYYVTINTEKPFTKTEVLFTRIILEGGKVIEAGKGFHKVK
jgi:hypothetical protein